MAETLEARQFFLRRLHSMSGLFPIGVYLFFHLGTNSLISANSPEKDFFQGQVDQIHSLGPLLIPVEILFIFVPIAFHAALGVKIWLESKPNARYYPYNGNIRYTLMRISGVVTLLFILVHLWHLHWFVAPLGGGHFRAHEASLSTAQAFQTAWWAPWVYAIGVVAACFHFANGMWTGFITWGVTVGPVSQRRMGFLCTALGVALTLVGLSAIYGFRTYSTDSPARTQVHATASAPAGADSAVTAQAGGVASGTIVPE